MTSTCVTFRFDKKNIHFLTMDCEAGEMEFSRKLQVINENDNNESDSDFVREYIVVEFFDSVEEEEEECEEAIVTGRFSS